MKYYDISRIKALNPDYGVIIGGRGNGKSFAKAKDLLESYFDHGATFVRIVRYLFDMQAKYISDYFEHVSIKEWLRDEYNAEVFFDSPNYVIKRIDEKGKNNSQIIGQVLALSAEAKYKSNQYPTVEQILLEEFTLLDPTRYLPDEMDKFLSILSTIVRSRDNVHVWMIGNTISKYNPYFKLLNIDINDLRLKPGDIKIVPQPDIGFKEKPKVVIEFAEMSYEQEIEIPRILKIGGNDTATTGLFEIPPDVIEPKDVKTEGMDCKIVQIGELLFRWYISTCFCYWIMIPNNSEKVDLLVKTMCYDQRKYFWNWISIMKQSGKRIPMEWYYDSDKTKHYVYENLLKESKRYM